MSDPQIWPSIELQCRFCGDVNRLLQSDLRDHVSRAVSFDTLSMVRCDDCDNGIADVDARCRITPL